MTMEQPIKKYKPRTPSNVPKYILIEYEAPKFRSVEFDEDDNAPRTIKTFSIHPSITSIAEALDVSAMCAYRLKNLYYKKRFKSCAHKHYITYTMFNYAIVPITELENIANLVNPTN